MKAIRKDALQDVTEHEFEAQRGLPEALPEGERVLWQGAPEWRSLAVHAFHVRKLVLYFGAILVVRGATVLSQGGSALDAMVAALWLLPVVALGLSIVTLMAWLSSRTTIYTITNRRVVMRIGIVLSLTFNLPYSRIAAAGLRRWSDGGGDIPVTLAKTEKIAFVHLWPHARPWRFARPEPMLRSVPEAAQVAAVLSAAWAEATGVALQPASPSPSPSTSPAPTPAPRDLPARPRHAGSVLATH